MRKLVRTNAYGKRATLFSAAFVLVASVFTFATPYIMNNNAYALAPPTEVDVRTASELIAATNDVTVTKITLKNNITVDQKLVVSGRSVFLEGNGYVLSRQGDGLGWQGNYVIQAYRTTLTLRKITLSGGDAAVYANGSYLAIQTGVNVSGNEFGGIELSRGSGVTESPVLQVNGPLTNTAEASGKPTVWVDKVATAGARISYGTYGGAPMTKTTHHKQDQYQYYLSEQNADIAAVNVTKNRTYNNVHSAVAEAVTGDVVELRRDITLNTESIKLLSGITFDGKGKTVTASFTGVNGTNNSAALYIGANGVTVKNVTIVGDKSVTPHMHGIQAYQVTGVLLDNVTLRNHSKSGLLVNGSAVTVNSITTSGNGWNGINVDKTGASLTVNGTSVHDERNGADIFTESRTIVSVNDTLHQYASRISGTNQTYTLRTAVPVATISVNGESSGFITNDRGVSDAVKVTVSATASRAIKSHWVEVKAPNGQLYYLTDMSAVASSKTFVLRNAAGIPMDSKGRLKEGVYTIRYVATDVNGVRNDIVAPMTFTLRIDNTLPTVNVSTTVPGALIVKNGQTFDATIAANDASGIKGDVEYSVLDADGLYVMRWKSAANNSTVSIDVDSLPGGEYTFRARAFDNADNKTSGVDIQFTINRTLTSDATISSLSTVTPVVSGVVRYANNDLASEVPVVVTLNGVDYAVQTDEDGVWTILPTGLAYGIEYTVTLNGGAGVVQDGVFTLSPVVIPAAFTPVTLQAQQQSTPITPATPRSSTPLGDASAAVLGDSTVAREVVANTSDSEDVEGTSDVKKLAATPTDAAKGLAWYWWVVIVAGIVALAWWVITAARNKRTEA